ncbi:anthrax toxin lethal factor-related metalloendopeptidase [Robertmurraya andreesenii]|uniref:ATLF-like domain-containing protein n=1 Tax=Anoxybacillus andreesenii TaxID=1325932 RepID=A0ABT9V2N0_9BACL|nr:toxin [Robertmurraya andreesenii]MDQ0155115.1 hypothetical protein [Robertmurraya andreesenii]
MRKLFLFIIVWIFSLAILGRSSASYDGILLKDYPHASFLRETLHLQDEDPVNEIIILPDEAFDEKKAASMITNIHQLPNSLLAKIQQNGIHIKLFNGKLTDNPTANHLKGVTPRGYKSQKQWDDVPGIGGSSMVLAKIGFSERGMGHGSVNLELHELAHSIDQIVYNNIRFDPIFLKIWSKEKNVLFPGQTYMLSFPEEYFAESFAMYYIDATNKLVLKKRAPKTYEYIKNLK